MLTTHNHLLFLHMVQNGLKGYLLLILPGTEVKSNELGFSKSSFLPPCSLSPSPSHHSAVGPQFTHLPLAVSVHCLSHPSFHSTPAELWLSYPTPARILNSFSIHLWGHLLLLSPSVYLFFYIRVEPGAPWSSMQAFCHSHLIFCTFWSLEKVKLWNLLNSSPEPPSTWFLFQQFLNRPKPTLLKPGNLLWGSEAAFCPVPSSQNPYLHCMIPKSKADPTFTLQTSFSCL